MNAVVLCPGPSLTVYQHYAADLLCGVNRAATYHRVDAWVCGDTPLVEQIADQVIGSPTLVTYGATRDTLKDHGFQWRNEIFSWTDIAQAWLHTSVVNWPWCSFTSAIVYATYRGAKRVEVYGADWEGKLDFDGVEAGKNRSVDRWRTERELFGALQIVLKERFGCEVVRHVA